MRMIKICKFCSCKFFIDIYLHFGNTLFITKVRDIPNHAIFLPNVHWWAWKSRLWFLRNPNISHYLNSPIIRTMCCCPSQMNEYVLFNNSKMTSENESICLRYASNFRSFVRKNNEECALDIYIYSMQLLVASHITVILLVHSGVN